MACRCRQKFARLAVKDYVAAASAERIPAEANHHCRRGLFVQGLGKHDTPYCCIGAMDSPRRSSSSRHLKKGRTKDSDSRSHLDSSSVLVSREQSSPGKPSMISIDPNSSEASFGDLGVLGDVDLDKILSADDEPPSSSRGDRDNSSARESRSSRRQKSTSSKDRDSNSSRRRVEDYVDASAKASKGREKAMRILGKSTDKDDEKSRGSSSRHKRSSKSDGRSTSRSRLEGSSSGKEKRSSRTLTADTGSVGGRSERSGNAASQTGGSQNGEKRKKSKMEKIEQLQAKNALYKEEYKRVQKDKKHLKKEIETKKLEVASLSKEIDTYIAETTMLKSQLSEALQQLDKNEDQETGESADDLAMELSRTRAELEVAVKRVADLKDQIEKLQKEVTQKENQVENFTEEVANQAMQLRELQMENEHLKENAKDSDRIPELQDENEKLQDELTSTLERAAAMVKEREDAIADLLKENDEIKDILASKESTETNKGSEENEEVSRLREEIIGINKTLEETQDRNVYLEEELENWIRRGGEMEKEIARLQDELDVLQRRTATADSNLEATNAKNEKLAVDLENAQKALKDAEQRHQDLVTELTNKHHQQITNMATNHKTALFEAKTRYAEELEKERAKEAEKAADADVIDQSELLRRSMASRKQPQTEMKGSWFGFGVNRSVSDDATDDLDEGSKRIKELEALNAKKDEEIKQLKSDLVRSRSTYNETIYMNKKQIEELSQENSAYAAKIATLEKMLEDSGV